MNIKIGSYYTPFKNKNIWRLKLIKEDSKFYYFDNGVKYSKDLPFYWHKVTVSVKVKVFLIDYFRDIKCKIKRINIYYFWPVILFFIIAVTELLANLISKI